ncbi:Sua5/YciO/YrdC/YwlC family protein [Candidatus Gracilibacteria bacterium]|nr:Sua5/YciO/YrdC/YwlC family protein [Candidatus Gracilibacteria bacterium]
MLYILPTDTCFGLACPISEPKSYEKIYQIKKREKSKPLSILVPNFAWLEKNTDLTSAQIDFLKNYEKPFTVLANCSYLKIWLNFVNEENNEEFFNRDIYEKFAFRVANNETQKKILKEVGPIFLTSANQSKESEIYSFDELKLNFGNLIDEGKITFLGAKKDLPKTKPSEIFEFIDESLERNFLRK